MKKNLAKSFLAGFLLCASLEGLSSERTDNLLKMIEEIDDLPGVLRDMLDLEDFSSELISVAKRAILDA